jgi:putative membrane protein
MVRLLIRIAVSLAVSAIALLIAAVVLDDFTISWGAFIVLVVVFGLILFVTRAVLESVFRRDAGILSSLVGIIACFLALVITDAVSDGLDIEGVSTWVYATLIVWGGTILANLLFGRWLFRKLTGRDDERRR